MHSVLPNGCGTVWALLPLVLITARGDGVIPEPFEMEIGSINSYAWNSSNPSVRAEITASTRPLMLTNTPVDSWAARKWTPEALAQLAPDVTLPIKNESNPVFYMGCCLLNRVKLPELIKMTEANAKQHVYFSGPLEILGPRVASQADPRVFDVDEAGGKPMDGFETKANLWIGNKGVITPTHFDEMHNIFVQIHGVKTFTLFPPSFWHELQVFPKFHHQHRNIQLDLEDEEVMNKTIENARASGNVLRVTLSPGAILYLPPLWFHRVETKSESSISINIWSASRHVLEVNNAWEENFPADSTWGMEEFLGSYSVFIKGLIDNLIPTKQKRGQFLWDLLKTRYLGLEAAKGEGDLTTTCPFDVHPESEEMQQHRKYIKDVEEQAPSFLSQSGYKTKDLGEYKIDVTPPIKKWCSKVKAPLKAIAKKYVEPVVRFVYP